LLLPQQDMQTALAWNSTLKRLLPPGRQAAPHGVSETDGRGCRALGHLAVQVHERAAADEKDIAGVDLRHDI